MRFVLFILLIFYTFSFINISLPNQQEQLKCIKITQVFPILDYKAKLSKYDTSYSYFYFFGNLRVYETPIYFDSVINNKLVARNFTMRYFVHQKDSLYGRGFDPRLRIYNARVHIDSFAYVRKDYDIHLREEFETLNMRLISTKRIKDSGRLHEVYAASEKTDTTYKNYWHFSFTNSLNDIPFDFSPYMDSLKNSKLYEFYIFNPRRFLKKQGLMMDSFYSSYKIERIDCPEKARIIGYIKAFLK